MPVATPSRKSKSKEPFHERHSDLFGTVSLYAPNTTPSKWGENPWVLRTERGPDGPLKFNIKPAYIMLAFERPHFVELNPEWVFPTVEL